MAAASAEHPPRPFGALPASAAFLIGGTLLFALPALLNGYPLVYYDTAAYLEGAFRSEWSPSRPIGYSLFLRFTSVLGSLWGAILVQAAGTSWLALRAASLFVGGARLPRLACATALAAGALLGGAKYTSWLMPDAFTAWLFLGALLAVASDHRLDRVTGAVAVGASTFVHASHLPVALATLLGAAYPAFRARRRAPWLWRRAAALAAFLLFCVPLELAVHRAFGYAGPAFGAHPAFLVNRFLRDGVLVRTLDRHGAERGWRLASYRDVLALHARYDSDPSDWLLWADDSPMVAERGWTDPAMVAEEREIVRLAIRDHPRRIVRAGLVAAWRQFWRTYAREEVSATTSRPVGQRLALFLPRDADRFYAGAQPYRLPVFTHIAPALQTWIHATSLSLCTALGIACGRSGRARLAWLQAAVLAFLAANALVAGFGSAVLARYQGRVAWLLPYAAILGVWSILGRSTRAGVSAPPA